MINGYIHPNGSYYEAEENVTGAKEVPKRPSKNHVWQTDKWVFAEESIDEVRATKLREVEARRAYYQTIPISTTINGTRYEYKSIETRLALITAWLALINDPDNDPVAASRDVADDNGKVATWTKTSLNALMPLVEASKQAGLGRYAAKKLSVENAPNVAALNAIDTTNW